MATTNDRAAGRRTARSGRTNAKNRNGRRRLMLGALAGAAAAAGLGGAVSAPVHANLPAATPRRRGYAQGPHGLVHYYDNGARARAGSLPLVLLHQAPQSARQFDAVYAPLAERGIRAVGVDTPGFGMSDVTSFVPKVEDWASSIAAVLDHLKLRKVDVLGHHTGSLLATEMALQYPQRVRCVILNGPFPITEEERGPRLERLKLNEIDFKYEEDGSHLLRSFAQRHTMYGPGADPRVTTRVVIERLQGFGPFWYGHNAAYRYDHASAMKKLKHRTLIFTNTGDSIYPFAQRARQIRPDFEYAELQGGTIDITEQQPQAWCDAVARFLQGARA